MARPQGKLSPPRGPQRTNPHDLLFFILEQKIMSFPNHPFSATNIVVPLIDSMCHGFAFSHGLISYLLEVLEWMLTHPLPMWQQACNTPALAEQPQGKAGPTSNELKTARSCLGMMWSCGQVGSLSSTPCKHPCLS